MNIHQLSQNAPTVGIAGAVQPGGATPPSPTAATSGASLLPEPSPVMVSLVGDMGAEIAALAVQQGQAQETIDSRAAETEDTVEDQAEAAQVSTLHDEASTMRLGAWTSGLCQAGAGALAIGSGAESIGGAAGSARAGDAMMLKGASEGLMAVGTMADGLSKAAATDTQALATGQKALGDASERAGEASRDGQKSATAFVQAAVDFYREYETAKAQAAAAAVHGA